MSGGRVGGVKSGVGSDGRGEDGGDSGGDAARLSLPPFSALRAFHAAARTGRLRLAAEEVGVTESAISHQIRKLEDFVRRTLFDRRPDGLALTAEGERFFQEIDPALRRISSATAALMGAANGARVSLTLPPSLAMLWLIPRLAAFEAAHPTVALNMVTTTKLVDLRRERVDIAIRHGRGSWPDVDAEFLMSEAATPVTAPDFFAAAPPDPAAAFAASRLIDSAIRPGAWTEWARARGLEPPDLAQALRFETAEQALEAAAQGLGIAMGFSPLIDDRLARGTLIAPFGRAERGPAAYYLCRALGETWSAPARRVAAWLRSEGGDRAVEIAED